MGKMGNFRFIMRIMRIMWYIMRRHISTHDRLLQVALLIEENYGQEFITPNIHLSLHITDCCEDYGPLYSFWCYSFERMNGLLGNKLIMLILCLCPNLPYQPPKNIPYCFL